VDEGPVGRRRLPNLSEKQAVKPEVAEDEDDEELEVEAEADADVA